MDNTVTIYYSDSKVTPDADLVAAFESGEPVFSYRCVSGDVGSIEHIDPPKPE